MNGCASGYQGPTCKEGKFVMFLQYNLISKISPINVKISIFFVQNVKLIISDQTVKKCATVLAKAATEQQGHVTLGVNRDGKDSIVTNVCL